MWPIIICIFERLNVTNVCVYPSVQRMYACGFECKCVYTFCMLMYANLRPISIQFSTANNMNERACLPIFKCLRSIDDSVIYGN